MKITLIITLSITATIALCLTGLRDTEPKRKRDNLPTEFTATKIQTPAEIGAATKLPTARKTKSIDTPKLNKDSFMDFVKKYGIDKDISERSQTLISELEDILSSENISPEMRDMAESLISELKSDSVLNEYHLFMNNLNEVELEHLKSIYADESVAKTLEGWSFQESNQEQLEADAERFLESDIPDERRKALKHLAEAYIQGLNSDALLKPEGEGGAAFYNGNYYLARLGMLLEGETLENIKALQSKFEDPIFVRERLERIAASTPFRTESADGSIEIKRTLRKTKDDASSIEQVTYWE